MCKDNRNNVSFWALLFLVLILASSFASAQGFDDTYEAYLGVNGDIYIQPKPKIIILHGDIAIPIVLPPPVEEFLLLPAGVTYSVNADTSGFDIGSAQLVDIVLGDFNVDGLVDIMVKGIPLAFDQVVFANSSGIPTVVTAADEEFQQFFTEIYNWMLNPNYFEENAGTVQEEQITEASHLYWSNTLSGANSNLASCSIDYGFGNCSYLGYATLQAITINDCYLFDWPPGFPDCDEEWYWVLGIEEIVTIVDVPDYSGFNQDALGFVTASIELDTVDVGELQDIWVLVSQTVETIGILDILEAVLGSEVFGGVLRTGGTIATDVLTGSDLDEERGFVLTAMIDRISQEVASTNPCRPFTSGEMAIIQAEGIPIDLTDDFQICNSAFDGSPFDIVVDPAGNMRIPQPNGLQVAWSTDYSDNLFSIIEKAVLLAHEPTHMYQYKKGEWTSGNEYFARAKEALISPTSNEKDYCYLPLVFGVAYEDYNLEEQAEMVSDRYRIDHGGGIGSRLICNTPAPGTGSTDLNTVIPF